MIAKVKGDLQRYKCRSDNHTSACNKLAGAQKRMQANLKQLKLKRSSLSSGGSKTKVIEIKSKLSANNCYENNSVLKVNAEEPKLKKENGVKILGKSGGQRAKSKVVALPNFSRQSGNYRTLCVINSDSFFFPISSNTSPSSFERDKLACRLMCPGTETNLFFHRSIGEESQDMISYRGQTPYIGQEYAYLPNKINTNSQASSCNMSAFYAEMNRREALISGGTKKPSKASKIIATVIPAQKVDPGEDPETISNIEGKLSDQDLDALVEINQANKLIEAENRNLRVVGPVFLQNNNDLNLQQIIE